MWQLLIEKPNCNESHSKRLLFLRSQRKFSSFSKCETGHGPKFKEWKTNSPQSSKTFGAIFRFENLQKLNFSTEGKESRVVINSNTPNTRFERVSRSKRSNHLKFGHAPFRVLGREFPLRMLGDPIKFSGTTDFNCLCYSIFSTMILSSLVDETNLMDCKIWS